MDRILTVEQMTFCEHEAEKYGVSLAQLMDNAAAQLAEVIVSNSSASSKIVLLIGKGNMAVTDLWRQIYLRNKT